MINPARKLKLVLTVALLACSLTASTANSLTPGTVLTRADMVCDVTGIVTEMKSIERSPWTDGTPSTLSVFETHIKLSIHKREPHNKNASAESPCHAALEKNELRTYKLCSSQKPRTGWRIKGTEGGSPGSSRIVRCLFDLEVVSRPEQPKN